MKMLCKLTALLLALILLLSSACAAYKTLSYGAQGAAVTKLQSALKTMGYSVKVDGKYGATTRTAVRNFQAAHGLKADGLAGHKTLSLLYDLTGQPSPSPVPDPGNTGLFKGNYTTLEYGDKGSRVTTLQKALKKLGYGTMSADGKFGATTRSAVKAFQLAYHLPTDGKAGKATLKKLEYAYVCNPQGGLSKSLRIGSSGATVKKVQTRLKELGWYTDKVDSKYGKSTYEAVRAFQKANGLYVDGICGNGTYKKLFSGSAVKKN